MSKFRFQINDIFFLQGNRIGIAGEVLPEDFPHVYSQDYKMKLMQGDKVLHNFESIGEDRFRRLPGANRAIRGFSTSDDIKELLTNNDLKTLYILGEERDKSNDKK
jgi:hypothetical protein